MGSKKILENFSWGSGPGKQHAICTPVVKLTLTLILVRSLPAHRSASPHLTHARNTRLHAHAHARHVVEWFCPISPNPNSPNVNKIVTY